MLAVIAAVVRVAARLRSGAASPPSRTTSSRPPGRAMAKATQLGVRGADQRVVLSALTLRNRRSGWSSSGMTGPGVAVVGRLGNLVGFEVMAGERVGAE